MRSTTAAACTERFRGGVLRALVFCGLFAACSQWAQADLPGASGTVAGTVRTPAGRAVQGAKVFAAGPRQSSTTTDAGGAFTLTLSPGFYRISISKSGYQTATSSDVTAISGQTLPLAITMTQADLSSLRTIGSVATTSRGSGSTINVGAASSEYVPAAAFQSFSSPQINDVLQHVSDVNIEHMGSQADTAIILNGSQPYETQVLIDGHPVALGQYGVWLSQGYPSFLIGGSETQSSAGNTTPFANIAVAGTVNLLTPSYTKRPSTDLVVGNDNYNAQYFHLISTGSLNRLSYVFGYGYGSSNGPYFHTSHCSITPDSLSKVNTPAAVGTIQFCGDASGSLFTRGQIAKLKYDLSDATSLEVGFTGAQGGYLPQGVSYGQYLGMTKIVSCLPSSPLNCNNPQYASLIGKTIPGYSWYPGSAVYSNQPMFSAQLRTTVGNNTVLLRPYAGNIQPETIDAVQEGEYPQYFSPVGTVPSLPSGTTIPNRGNSLPGGGNAFEQDCTIGFNPTGYHQVNSPQNKIAVVNGQEECFQVPFESFEIDKLYGSTASLLHPVGDGLLDFTYDTHATDTFAFYSGPANVAVPDSIERYTTFSLTGDIRAIPKVGVSFGIYDTTWKLIGSQAIVDPVSQSASLAPFTRTITRFDPHVALVYRPKSDLSYRLAYGTSETFPYAGQVSGLPSYQPPAASTNYQAFLLQKNPQLNPERSISFNLGADRRFHNGSVLSMDLQDTVIHDVFEPLTFPAATALETITEPINVARMRMQLATLRYAFSPNTGLGFNLAATAERAIVDGIPPAVYAAGAGLPANEQQICGSGQTYPNNPVCIPYLKGYGQLTYTWHDRTNVELGLEYQGKNNSYFQPPFAQMDLAVRRPIRKNLEFQASVQNLLNMFNYYNLPYAGQGVPLVAGTPTGLTSLSSTYVPAPPRTVRVQFRFHMGS